jgi:hypothetical protein
MSIWNRIIRDHENRNRRNRSHRNGDQCPACVSVARRDGSLGGLFCKLSVLIFLVAISIALTGCATAYTPVPGKTTFNEVRQKLGAPDKQIALDGDVMKARWWRTAFSGASSSGQQISVALTFFDGEFEPGGLLRRWRAVDKNVPLDVAYGFDLKNLDWSVGYLTHDNNFVDDHNSGSLRRMGLPDYQNLQLNGALYTGQVIGR